MHEPNKTLANLPASRVLSNGTVYPMNLKQVCDGEATCPGEGCPHEVPVEHPSVAETMAEDALKPKDKPLTEPQFRALRRAFFTVRHLVLPDCGHKLDQINQPKLNCEFCWWAFFSSHGELVQVTDRAFQEQGSDFLDKMRGIRYRKMFIRYMSTLARLQKEAAEIKAKSCDVCHGEKNGVPGNGQIVDGMLLCDYCHAERMKNGSNKRSESEVRGNQQSGNEDGREIRTDGDVPVSG